MKLYVANYNKTHEEENEILTIRGNLGCKTYNQIKIMVHLRVTLESVSFLMKQFLYEYAHF